MRSIMENKIIEPRQRLRGLDGLRGLAALMVVLYHFINRYNVLYGHVEGVGGLPYGYMGVHLFFIISGFVILLTLDKSKSAADFMVRRFSRLYPAYWAGVLVTALCLYLFGLPEKSISWELLAVNMTMLQGFFKVPAVDGVYWTLTIELCFYALMFAVFVTKQMKNLPWICLGWMAFSLIWQTNPQFHTSGVVRALVFPLITKYAYLFCAGVSFYRMYSKQSTKIDYGVIGLSVISAFFILSMEELICMIVLGGLFATVVFSSGKISGLFSSKLLVYLGGISYSYYLTHQYIGYMVMRYGYSLGLSYFAVLLIAIVITLLLATILNRFIEVPGSRKLRKALEKKFQLSR